MAMVAITGVLRTTAMDMLDLHVNLLPTDLLLHKIWHRSAMHLASLPDPHPLSSIYQTLDRWYVKSHRSPLHEFAFIYDVTPGSMEKIGPVKWAPG